MYHWLTFVGLSSYLEATPDLKSDAYIVCISPAVSSYADDSDTGRGGVGGGGGVAADSVSPLSLDSLEHKHYSPNIRRYVVTVVRGTVPPLYPDSIVRPPTETLFLLITVGLRRIYNPDNILRGVGIHEHFQSICLEFMFIPCVQEQRDTWNLRCRCTHKCVCWCVLCCWSSSSLSLGAAGCSVQINMCTDFRALMLRQALSAGSPVGCVSPALGDINTSLMSPFL